MEFIKNYWFWRMYIHNGIQSGKFYPIEKLDSGDLLMQNIFTESLVTICTTFCTIITCLFLMWPDQLMYPFKICYIGNDLKDSYMNCFPSNNLCVDLICLILVIPINILMICYNSVAFIVFFVIFLISGIFLLIQYSCVEIYHSIFEKSKMILPK